MKLPLKLGSARADPKNGGEFYVVKDAEGAWIGNIRVEHAPEIVVALNAARPEVAQNDIADVQNAAWAFRETLIPRADQMAGGVFPLWHGWAIFDAFMAGAAFARSPLARK